MGATIAVFAAESLGFVEMIRRRLRAVMRREARKREMKWGERVGRFESVLVRALYVSSVRRAQQNVMRGRHVVGITMKRVREGCTVRTPLRQAETLSCRHSNLEHSAPRHGRLSGIRIRIAGRGCGRA